MEINDNDVFGILGLNGSGKTTLIKAITGIIRIDNGSIIVNDVKPNSSNYRKQFSSVYQTTGLDFYINVVDNLEIHAMYYGLNNKNLNNKIDFVIELMGLQDYRKKIASELSGGYKKRLQIAKALLVDSPVMIFDEATVGLDVSIKNDFFKVIENLRSSGKTIIYTTQILEEVERICNKVCILNAGEIKSVGTIQEIKNNYNKNNILIIKTNDLVSEEFVIQIQRMFREAVLDISCSDYQIQINSSAALDEIIPMINKIKDMIAVRELEFRQAELEEILLGGENLGIYFMLARSW